MKVAGKIANLSMTGGPYSGNAPVPSEVSYQYKGLNLEVGGPSTPVNQVATFDLDTLDVPYPFDFSKDYAFTIEPLNGDVGQGGPDVFSCSGVQVYGGASVWYDDDGEQPPSIEQRSPTYEYGLVNINITKGPWPKVQVDNITLNPSRSTESGGPVGYPLDLEVGKFYTISFGEA